MPDATPDEHVVLLVHGIRDHALWQSAVRNDLERAGFIVEATNYGRFNLLQFLLPIRFFRKRAIQSVWKQIRIVRQAHPSAAISVIAHSFGTYIIANIIRDEFEAKFHRVIFCGSVVPYDFPFEQVSNRFEHPIINEVGTADIWPAMAQSVTWGYGSAGSFAFRRPLVRDRWHEGAKHGYFFKNDFCRKFWIPFLGEDKLIRAADNPSPQTWPIQLVHILPIKYVLLALAGALAAWLWFAAPPGGDGELTPPTEDVALPPAEAGFDLDMIIRNSGEARKWLEIAAGELGQREIDGDLHNPRIVEYFDSVDFPGPHTDETHWSSVFMNWVMEQAGYRGTRSAVNASWSEWGRAVARRVGCIAFFERATPGAGTGTVGFYLGGSDGKFQILGGNINDAVSIVSVPDSRFVHCRWPTTSDIME